MRINQWWGTQFQNHMNNAKITKPTTPKSTVSTAMYSTACLIFFHYDSCYAAMICHAIILSHPTPARCRTRASLGTWPPHPSAHHALASREWYWVVPSWRAKKSLHFLRTVDHPHHISSCSRHLTPILGIFVLLILLVLVTVDRSHRFVSPYQNWPCTHRSFLKLERSTRPSWFQIPQKWMDYWISIIDEYHNYYPWFFKLISIMFNPHAEFCSAIPKSPMTTLAVLFGHPYKYVAKVPKGDSFPAHDATRWLQQHRRCPARCHCYKIIYIYNHIYTYIYTHMQYKSPIIII